MGFLFIIFQKYYIICIIFWQIHIIFISKVLQIIYFYDKITLEIEWYTMATMSIRLSDNDKNEADNLFKKLGITTNSAINMFIKQSIRMQSLPFTPTLNTNSQRLEKALEESEIIMQELKNGKRKGYTDTDSLFKALDDDIQV